MIHQAGTRAMEPRAKRGGAKPATRGTAIGAVAMAMLAAGVFGCAVTPNPPIEKPAAVAASPLPGRVTLGVQRADSVGGVVPVYVSIANGTDIPRAVLPNDIFAINASGERVAPLAPSEAARRAGGAVHLKSMLVNAAASGVTTGALGAGMGAAAGSLSGGGALSEGTIIGGALAAAGGIFASIAQTQSQAQSQAREQIDALALRSEDLKRNLTASGYVFFPDGDYREIDVILINRETGDTEMLQRPWP
jgi:hypothetical protein